MENSPPTIIVVAGASSNVGKTTLVCDLLGILPGWEAIKVTRGHYRSCGRNTEACCVSDLLGERPRVYSNGEATRVDGKDTDRFWRAGASAVHWVIAKSDQVKSGLDQAISRVRAPGVVVEATSVLDFLSPAFSILVAGMEGSEVKPSARRALRNHRIDAIYLPFAEGSSAPDSIGLLSHLRRFTPSSQDILFATVLSRIATNAG